MNLHCPELYLGLHMVSWDLLLWFSINKADCAALSLTFCSDKCDLTSSTVAAEWLGKKNATVSQFAKSLDFFL